MTVSSRVLTSGVRHARLLVASPRQRGTLRAVAARGTVVALTLVLTIVTSRVLGPSERGAFSLAVLIAGILAFAPKAVSESLAYRIGKSAGGPDARGPSSEVCLRSIRNRCALWGAGSPRAPGRPRASLR